LLPIAAALLLPLLKLAGKNRKMIYTTGASACCLVLAVYLALRQQGQSFTLFMITDQIPVLLRVDGLSAVYLVLASLLWVGVVLYSHDYVERDQHENGYYVFLLAVLGCLMGVALAGNIVTFFLFYEFMTFMCFPLICHDRTEESVKASIVFLIYSIFSATMVLFGVVILSGLGDISSFAAGGVLAGNGSDEAARITLALLLMLFGFGCKAGLYPLQAWLPIAHPAAPAPISAILSALVTKAGIIGVIRTIFYIVGVDFLKGTWLQYLWLAMTLATVFIGSALAFREPLLKKRLAYSSVSQISYILFGLAILEPAGFSGAGLQLIFHAFAKLILFLCAGAIIHNANLYYVGELKGIGKKMPVIMWCFALSSLSLIGIPPFGGFTVKWHLISAALNADIGVFSWLGPVVLLISAILTAGYLLPIVISAFFPGADYDYAGHVRLDPGWRMKIPMVALTGLAVILGLLPKDIISYLTALAENLMGV